MSQLSIRVTYTFVYQCRHCLDRTGKPSRFDGRSIEVVKMVAQAALEYSLRTTRIPTREAQPMQVVHECVFGDFGVADLIGVRKENKE